MYNLLILGHKGMLGNAVFKYFSSKNRLFNISVTDLRWPSDDFKKFLLNSNFDFIINCIGAIPQKKNNEDYFSYYSINIELPIFLGSISSKIIHPSTDCEFSGDLPVNKKYDKDFSRDASDEYGKSKALISKKIEEKIENTKIIRTSIIGHELGSKNSLLEWVLSSEGTVNGYTNHYWNGVTTLEWSYLCESLITNWDCMPKLNQYGTRDVKNKFELLKDICDVYNKKITIIPFEDKRTLNRCLVSDKDIKSIKDQLLELKSFYNII